MAKILRSVVLLGIFAFAGKGAFAETPYEVYYLKKDSFQSRITELRAEFGANKIIPAEVETECLAALSFYPELKNTFIEFKFAKLRTTMVSRPKANCIGKNKLTREYVIVINSRAKDNGTLSWDELTFNALTGWIGHELGHIAYYNVKTVPGILIAGIRYLHPEFKRSMERQTDMTAIQHDMGFALYEGVQYTFCCSKAHASYKECLKKYYLSMEEIVQHSSVRVRLKQHKKKDRRNEANIQLSEPAVKAIR